MKPTDPFRPKVEPVDPFIPRRWLKPEGPYLDEDAGGPVGGLPKPDPVSRS